MGKNKKHKGFASLGTFKGKEEFAPLNRAARRAAKKSKVKINWDVPKAKPIKNSN